MFCAGCGNSLVDDAKFCNKCGVKTNVTENILCSNCGNKLDADSKFCANCGTKAVVGGDVNNTPIAVTTSKQSTKEIEESYKRGKECLDGGIFETAFKYFQEAAEQGHAGAQYELAEMYQLGEGVPESERHATKWYGMAAAKGHAEAQYSLALQYMEGEDTGVEKDITTAVKWLQLSAEQGCGGALCTLGELYAKGDGVPQDVYKAKELYAKATQKGNIHASVKLAALELLVQITEQNLLNQKETLSKAITEFFKKVTPLFEGQEDLENIHFANVSKSFEKKLKGALTYAKLQNAELPLIVMDSTVFGNAKTGALLTTHAFYIKDIANKTETVVISDIKYFSKKQDGHFYKITVNDRVIGSLVRQPQNIILLKSILSELTNVLRKG